MMEQKMPRYAALVISVTSLFHSGCSENGTQLESPTVWADEVAYDNIDSYLRAETAQQAIDELSSGSLARDLVGRWEGYVIDTDGSTGEEIDCPSVVVFEFSNDGTYNSNFDTSECEYGNGLGPELRLWEGRYWAFGDNLLIVVTKDKAMGTYGKLPMLVARDGTSIVLDTLSSVGVEIIILEKMTED